MSSNAESCDPNDSHHTIGLALSSVIGNKTISSRLVDVMQSALNASEDLEWFGSRDDYRQFPAPRFLRLSPQLEAEHVFTLKLQSRRSKLPPTIIACTLEVAAAITAHAPETHLIVATDATPAFTSRLFHVPETPRWRQGLKTAVNVLLDRHYRAMIRNVRAWLPLSNACKRSLVEDYGVTPEACFVTRSPQSRIANAPPMRDMSDGFRVLIVANDFVLKGGEALVAAVNKLSRVRLLIISNDAAAKHHASPGKIDVVSGLTTPEEIIPYYRSSHLLMHPTRRDCYSHVMCEALAQGCPVAVTEDTPPAEIVHESGAGWLIPRPADTGSLTETIENIRSQPHEIDRRAEAAIQYARSHLSMDRFAAAVREALQRAPNPSYRIP